MANIGAAIPKDVSDKCCFCMVVAPESWVLTVSSCIDQLRRGRYWDKDTGRIVDAQKIGKEISDSFMACDCDYFEQIITALDNISAKLDIIGGKDPIVVNTHPVTVESHPVTIETYPVSVNTYPVTVESHPVTIETYPVSVNTYPVTVESHPITIETYPITISQAAPILLDKIERSLADIANFAPILSAIKSALQDATAAQIACCSLDGEIYDPTRPYVGPIYKGLIEDSKTGEIIDDRGEAGVQKIQRCDGIYWFLEEAVEILRFLSRSLAVLASLVYLKSVVNAVMYLLDQTPFTNFFRTANSQLVIDMNTQVGGVKFGQYSGILTTLALNMGAAALDELANLVRSSVDQVACDISRTSEGDPLINIFYDYIPSLTNEQADMVNMLLSGGGVVIYRAVTSQLEPKECLSCWSMVYEKRYTTYDGFGGVSNRLISVFFDTTLLLAELYFDSSQSSVPVSLTFEQEPTGVRVGASFVLDTLKETYIKIIATIAES